MMLYAEFSVQGRHIVRAKSDVTSLYNTIRTFGSGAIRYSSFYDPSKKGTYAHRLGGDCKRQRILSHEIPTSLQLIKRAISELSFFFFLTKMLIIVGPVKSVIGVQFSFYYDIHSCCIVKIAKLILMTQYSLYHFDLLTFSFICPNMQDVALILNTLEMFACLCYWKQLSK